jgi:hypothetical protein
MKYEYNDLAYPLGSSLSHFAVKVKSAQASPFSVLVIGFLLISKNPRTLPIAR